MRCACGPGEQAPRLLPFPFFVCCPVRLLIRCEATLLARMMQNISGLTCDLTNRSATAISNVLASSVLVGCAITLQLCRRACVRSGRVPIEDDPAHRAVFARRRHGRLGACSSRQAPAWPGVTVVLDYRAGAAAMIGRSRSRRTRSPRRLYPADRPEHDDDRPSVLQEARFLPVKDFSPLSLVAIVRRCCWWVIPRCRREREELVALAKARPGRSTMRPAGLRRQLAHGDGAPADDGRHSHYVLPYKERRRRPGRCAIGPSFRSC